jgi:hypothetical protein
VKLFASTSGFQKSDREIRAISDLLFDNPTTEEKWGAAFVGRSAVFMPQWPWPWTGQPQRGRAKDYLVKASRAMIFPLVLRRDTIYRGSMHTGLSFVIPVLEGRRTTIDRQLGYFFENSISLTLFSTEISLGTSLLCPLHESLH